MIQFVYNIIRDIILYYLGICITFKKHISEQELVLTLKDHTAYKRKENVLFFIDNTECKEKSLFCWGS